MHPRALSQEIIVYPSLQLAEITTEVALAGGATAAGTKACSITAKRPATGARPAIFAESYQDNEKMRRSKV